MMIATGFPAIDTSTPQNEAGDYTGDLRGGKTCEIPWLSTRNTDLCLKNKPIGVHFLGIGTGPGKGDSPSLSFADYVSECSFCFTALQHAAAQRGRGISVMRRANAQLQSDRRAEILAAAQRCFVRSGFHGASMQDICAEAGMSPGNLYRYFPSKEALIAGIAERDRAEVAQQFASADLSQGFFAVLEGMAHHHFAVRPDEQVLLCTEVMSEARRNPEIARISAAFDADVRKWLVDLLRAAAERGDIAGDVDFDGVVTMLMIIADGVWWRRALDPDFDPEAVLPIFMDITRHMLRGRPKAASTSDAAASPRTRRAPDESKPHHCRRPGRRRRALDRVRPFPAARDRAKAAPPFAPAKARPRSCSASRSPDTSVRAAQPQARPRPAAPRPTSKRRPSRRAPAACSPSCGCARGTWVQEGRRHRRALRRGARGAGRAGAGAWSMQKRTELDAKRQLIMNGTLPKLELVDLEAQLKAAEAALAAAEAERDRGVVRAPVVGRRARRGGRGRPGGVLVRRPRNRADRRARSDAGGGRGRRAQARRHQGRRHRPRCGW